MQKVLGVEQCPYCEQLTNITKVGVNQCSNCGKYIAPCCLCDMNKVDCNNCVTEQIAHNKNKE